MLLFICRWIDGSSQFRHVVSDTDTRIVNCRCELLYVKMNSLIIFQNRVEVNVRNYLTGNPSELHSYGLCPCGPNFQRMGYDKLGDDPAEWGPAV